jgi:WhiB family redox-sensing transcriptional regulator
MELRHLLGRIVGPDLNGEAACAQFPGDLFFPEKGERNRNVRRICIGCEVRQSCLEFAIAHDEEGVWGGTTQFERRQLRRTRARRAA